ncbi:hypothetical protein ACF1CG_13625 [Streptomyces sp. NPDC014773]|uniref:hypothetical protein n=1 Tax=Streptomyces sp. NPDC014773 TaxID=3364908 RepID=UPI0037035FAD
MSSGLRQAGLDAWCGPATPWVRRIRFCRPNRWGRLVLRRWLRVVLLRAVALGAVAGAVELWFTGRKDVMFAAALPLAFAAFCWRCSLIGIVLRPGEIVRCSILRHTVVPAGAVRRLHRDSWHGGLVLETRAGEEVDFLWFENSLWDLLYDFSAVCEDAMRAHARQSRGTGHTSSTVLIRRFTWSPVGDLLALSAVACPIVTLIARA